MLKVTRSIPLICATVLALLVAGCGASIPGDLEGDLNTGSLNAQKSPIASLSGTEPTYNGSPVSLYTLIARGANSCWLGPNRPLHMTHLLRAKVSSRNKQVKKAESSIVIYERDSRAKPKKLVAALRINIRSISTGQSSIEVINRRFSVPTLQLMTIDVRRWARSDLSCADEPASPSPIQPTPAAITPIPKKNG